MSLYFYNPQEGWEVYFWKITMISLMLVLVTYIIDIIIDIPLIKTPGIISVVLVMIPLIIWGESLSIRGKFLRTKK